jgi:hypothetical protein
VTFQDEARLRRGHNDQSRRGHQCSETWLTGKSRFHRSTPLGIEHWSLMMGSKRVDHWTSGTVELCVNAVRLQALHRMKKNLVRDSMILQGLDDQVGDVGVLKLKAIHYEMKNTGKYDSNPACSLGAWRRLMCRFWRLHVSYVIYLRNTS